MRQEEKRFAILKILQSADGPVPSREIGQILKASGYDLSDRTVRLYLGELEKQGLIESLGRRGRTLSPLGNEMVRTAHVADRVGFLSAKIDRMTYRMSYDIERGAGEVVVNMSLVEPAVLLESLDSICQVFAKGYAMGDRAGLLLPGESLGEMTVPPGKLGFCTVCSITLNGVLLKHGVPTRSRFGGLLQLEDGKATRFVELIEYDGTSIDPLEVFIRAGLTDYLGAIRTRTGRIGASFREFPSGSRALVKTLTRRMQKRGLGALWDIGYPGRPLLDIPVSEGRIGAIIIGGLNPIAVLEEQGRRIESRALSGLIEFDRLFHYTELGERIRAAAGKM